MAYTALGLPHQRICCNETVAISLAASERTLVSKSRALKGKKALAVPHAGCIENLADLQSLQSLFEFERSCVSEDFFLNLQFLVSVHCKNVSLLASNSLMDRYTFVLCTRLYFLGISFPAVMAAWCDSD